MNFALLDNDDSDLFAPAVTSSKSSSAQPASSLFDDSDDEDLFDAGVIASTPASSSSKQTGTTIMLIHVVSEQYMTFVSYGLL